MKNCIYNIFLCVKNKLDYRFLCLLYFAGLITGSCLSFVFSKNYTSYSFSSLLTVPSFGHLFLANLIPIICIISLTYFSLQLFCYPVLFLRSVLCGFTGMAISVLTGSAGWLLRILLMFSSGLISVCIWYLLQCKINGTKKNTFVILFFVVLGITLFDYCFVSRFLHTLIVYY